MAMTRYWNWNILGMAAGQNVDLLAKPRVHGWGFREKDGLSGLTAKQRQDLAANMIVRLEPGEGWQSRVLTVIDRGVGIPPILDEGHNP